MAGEQLLPQDVAESPELLVLVALDSTLGLFASRFTPHIPSLSTSTQKSVTAPPPVPLTSFPTALPASSKQLRATAKPFGPNPHHPLTSTTSTFDTTETGRLLRDPIRYPLLTSACNPCPAIREFFTQPSRITLNPTRWNNSKDNSSGLEVP